MSKQFYFKQFSFVLVRSLNIKTVLFQVIQFSISTQFSSIWPINRALSGATTPGQRNLGAMAMTSASHSPKLQHHWNLTISFFSVIFRTLVGGGLPLCRGAVSVFYSPSWQEKNIYIYLKYTYFWTAVY